MNAPDITDGALFFEIFNASAAQTRPGVGFLDTRDDASAKEYFGVRKNVVEQMAPFHTTQPRNGHDTMAPIAHDTLAPTAHNSHATAL